MRNRSVVLLIVLMVPFLAARQVPATSALTASPQAAAASPSARIWAGRNTEFEAYIRDTPIDHFEEVPIGVTHPKRAYFKSGGLVESVAWKILPPGRPAGYWESYKSEIAAYELDKLLNLRMIPPAVERQINGETGAAVMWVDG